MAKRIKQLRIRQTDGTWSQPYDVGFSESSVTSVITPIMEEMQTTVNNQYSFMNTIGFNRFCVMLDKFSSATRPTFTFIKTGTNTQTGGLNNFQYNETTDTLFVFFNGLLLNPSEYNIVLKTNGDIEITLKNTGEGNPPHVFSQEWLELVFFRKYVQTV